jgi:hypothetical protein
LAVAIKNDPATADAARAALAGGAASEPAPRLIEEEPNWDLQEEVIFLDKIKASLAGHAASVLATIQEVDSTTTYEQHVGYLDAMWAVYVKVAAGVISTSNELATALAEVNALGSVAI